MTSVLQVIGEIGHPNRYILVMGIDQALSSNKIKQPISHTTRNQDITRDQWVVWLLVSRAR